MEPLLQELHVAHNSPPTLTPVHEPLPKTRYVVVVSKERRYDGAHKIWAFSGIYAIAIVNGRLQLIREGYGLVFDMPYEEVEQVYAEPEAKALQVA